jgi:hypothetical protein
MKVRVLRPALEDLANGREFYNQQQEGVGEYFFDSLFSEIDSLVLYAGIHESNSGIIACWRAASLMPSIIASLRVKQSFFGCWTAADLHDGSGSLSRKQANENAAAPPDRLRRG